MTPASETWSTAERERYARQFALPGFGEAGQAALRRAKVLLVGAGGLGSPAALYLAAAGVGELHLLDDDTVALSNLQRQILYGTSAVGQGKVAMAAGRLGDLNPLVTVHAMAERLTAANADARVGAVDLVIDGSDNLPTRDLLNAASLRTGVPWIYGSVFRFEGQVAVFGTPGGPCYRCLYPAPPAPDACPSCAEAGVLGVVPGLVGMLQAVEAIKLLTGIGEPLAGRLLHIDLLGPTFRTLALPRDPACRACGNGAPPLTSPAPSGESTMSLPEIDVHELQRRLATEPAPLLLDVREPWEYEKCRLPDSLLIPLAALPERAQEIPTDRPVVVYCRSGGRSAMALQYLMGQGHRDICHLKGGILDWGKQIDPSIPPY
jgi:adenylyltransferase/sulfurtransferase